MPLGSVMTDIRDLFNGEMHELFPGRDWKSSTEKVVEWAERTSQTVPHTELETPDLNWVFEPLSAKEAVQVGVADGWSRVAIMLQKTSRALGGKPVCYQKGSRYFFQHKLEEE